MKLNIFTKSKKSISSEFQFFLLVFLILIFTRIGFWNLIIVDGKWDEITYLIVGREIVNGKVPYIDFYEIKTIFSFFPYIFASLLTMNIRHKNIGFFFNFNFYYFTIFSM